MPFKSEKQRKWMWANDPEMAEKWSNEEDEIEETVMRITKRQLRRIIREAVDDGGQAQLAQALKSTGPVPLTQVADALNGLGYYAQLESAMGIYWVSVINGPGIWNPLEIANVSQTEVGPNDIVVGKLVVGSLE